MMKTIVGSDKPNILIVDDVSTNLVILAEMIKSTGCTPRPVISVKQAQAAITKKIPQLILLDISMPEIDGFEFCSMLKADVKTRDIPIIFISALDSVEDKIKGFKLGAVDYISKPFEKEEVTQRVNTHLKIYRMQQELESYNKKLYKMVNDQIQKVQEEQRNILHALAMLAETKEMDGENHLKTVGINCRLLSISMQFSPRYDCDISTSFIDEIELAAQLHDIGIIAIQDQILLKPGKLTKEEWAAMTTHTEIGARHLTDIYEKSGKNDFMKMAIEIAHYHHENWDGSGYPQGLKGEAIPLAARIVAIIDTFNALTRDRCYRKAYSREESLQIMEKETGHRFDPEIMKIFMKVQNQIKGGK